MRFTKRWAKRLRALARKEAVERELDEELEFHLEMEAQRLMREERVEEPEARRRAAIAFGGKERYKEEVRDARVLGWVPGAALDFRLGVRMLRKYPGLTIVGVFGMAVGIAVGAGVFSAIASVIDPALPLDEGDRIVAVLSLNAATGQDESQTYLHDLETWREELSVVEDFGAYRTVDRNLHTPDGTAEPRRVAEITATGFRVARVSPLLGRYLVEEDEEPGAEPVVVLGHRIWQNRLGGRPDVVGQTIQLGTVGHTIVGVMPEGFAFPVNNALWTPLRLEPLDYDRGEAPPINVFGRLAPGATPEQAQAQLDVLAQRAATEHPETHQHIRTRILPYARSLLDSPELTWAFYLVQLAAALLLVVVAVNVAILVYARTATRTGEIAVRRALGASRGRVVVQLFAEALVLSVGAAAIGLLAARFALGQVNEFIARLGGEQVPFWWDFSLAPATVGYAAGLAILAALIVGVAPAIKATRTPVQSTLRELGGGTGMRMGRTWTALIVAQVAVAVAILPLAVALGWSEVSRSASRAPGYAVEKLLSARLSMDRETPPTAEAESYRQEFASRFAARHSELVARLEAEPGIAAVTFTSHLPGSGFSAMVEVEDPQAAEPSSHQVVLLQVDPGMFEDLDVPILAGRPLGPSDAAGGAAAVVANRSFVRQVLGGGSGLGRRFRYSRVNADVAPGSVREGEWYEVVGVVGDFPPKQRASGMGEAVLYHAAAPGSLDPVSIIARVEGRDPEALAGRFREITAALDPTLRISQLQSAGEVYRQGQRTKRLIVAAIGVVTLSILLLSAAGIHALMSFTVARRRREIGIRTALGAQPRRLLASVFSRTLRQLALGSAIGSAAGGALIFAGGFAADRALAVLLAVILLMTGVGLLAALGPARKGLGIEPSEALRADA